MPHLLYMHTAINIGSIIITIVPACAAMELLWLLLQRFYFPLSYPPFLGCVHISLCVCLLFATICSTFSARNFLAAAAAVTAACHYWPSNSFLMASLVILTILTNQPTSWLLMPIINLPYTFDYSDRWKKFNFVRGCHLQVGDGGCGQLLLQKTRLPGNNAECGKMATTTQAHVGCKDWITTLQYLHLEIHCH